MPYVNGQVMRTRSKDMGGRTGQHHAERMHAQAVDIPTEWRQFCLVFPDTLWRHPGGFVCVPCLGFHDGRWVLYFRSFARDDWDDLERVVRVCK